MLLQVNLFQRLLNYYVKPTITIKQIYDYIVKEIDLQNAQCFGLQVYHPSKVWLFLKPAQSLAEVVKLLQGEEVSLLFRARSIDAAVLETVKDDHTGLMLFYWQVKEQWNAGYSIGTATEMHLLALHLLIELGPLAQLMAKSSDPSDLAEMVKSFLKVDDGKTGDPEMATERVLQWWNRLGNMSENDGLFNYVSVAISRHCVKNGLVKDEANLAVLLSGIQKDSSVPGNLKWTSLRKVSRHSNKLIFKFYNKAKQYYELGNKQLAKFAWSSIVEYHQMYLQDKYSQNKSTNSCARLTLGNVEKWIDDIARNILKQVVGPQMQEDYRSKTIDETLPSNSKDLGPIINELDQWMESHESTAGQMAAMARGIQALCHRVQQQVLHLATNKNEATDNKVVLMEPRDYLPKPTLVLQEKVNQKVEDTEAEKKEDDDTKGQVEQCISQPEETEKLEDVQIMENYKTDEPNHEGELKATPESEPKVQLLEHQNCFENEFGDNDAKAATVEEGPNEGNNTPKAQPETLIEQTFPADNGLVSDLVTDPQYGSPNVKSHFKKVGTPLTPRRHPSLKIRFFGPHRVLL